jgi:hypothetical protein
MYSREMGSVVKIIRFESKLGGGQPHHIGEP